MMVTHTHTKHALNMQLSIHLSTPTQTQFKQEQQLTTTTQPLGDYDDSDEDFVEKKAAKQGRKGNGRKAAKKATAKVQAKTPKVDNNPITQKMAKCVAFAS